MLNNVSVRRLAREQAGLVADVLIDAFRRYPVMMHVLRGLDDYERKLRTLIRFFVLARAYRGEPMLGIGSETVLDAAATVSFPGAAADPGPAFAELQEQVWNDLGTEARGRYTAFSEAGRRVIVDGPHVHLNMIGVRPTMHGRGLARPLLEQVHAISASRARSEGVTLTTENPANVPLYEHFGYAVSGHEHVAPDLETWGMFRPDKG